MLLSILSSQLNEISISFTQPSGVASLDVVDMFPITQKHTLGRVVNLDVILKPSIIKDFRVTSIPRTQRGTIASE